MLNGYWIKKRWLINVKCFLIKMQLLVNVKCFSCDRAVTFLIPTTKNV
jgi:hypothetical protein